MTEIITFRDYAILILNRDFPVIRSRKELLEFMAGDMVANILWSDYIDWHCGVNPALHRCTFRAWMNQLQRDKCSHSEWSFISDLKQDRKFPAGGLDNMTEYLMRIDAHDSTLDSLESLWIKFHFKN